MNFKLLFCALLVLSLPKGILTFALDAKAVLFLQVQAQLFIIYPCFWSLEFNKFGGGIAQTVERGTENPCVLGSIPGPATI